MKRRGKTTGQEVRPQQGQAQPPLAIPPDAPPGPRQKWLLAAAALALVGWLVALAVMAISLRQW